MKFKVGDKVKVIKGTYDAARLTGKTVVVKELSLTLGNAFWDEDDNFFYANSDTLKILSHARPGKKQASPRQLKFKAGDKIIHKKYGWHDTVESVPGMEEYDKFDGMVDYDKFHFSDAAEGMITKDHSWDFQKYWKLDTKHSKKKGGNMTKKEIISNLRSRTMKVYWKQARAAGYTKGRLPKKSMLGGVVKIDQPQVENYSFCPWCGHKL